MNLAFFIARRTAQRTPENKPGVMERIAVISVALSVAVMLLAMAVIMGFKQEVSRKVAAFSGHAVVNGVRGVGTLDSDPVRRSARAEELIRTTEGFVSLAPYAVKGGIVRTADAVQGVMLKGVDGDYDWSSFGQWLVEGELPRVGDSVRTKDILLSRGMAEKLMLGVGDKVEMLFVETGDRPRRDRFKVAGIYSSGMDEMDDAVIMTDLRNVQRLADWSDGEISGYEIFTSDLAGADDFARRLGRTLLYDDADDTANLAVSSVTELYPNIFDWLKAHDVNAAVIIGIMLVVAFFNMTSALLILVLERTRMIGLLKAFGMRNATLREVFLWRAAFVTLRGLAWGNAAGLAVCLVQKYFHVVKLSSEGYLLSEVPVALGWGWWLALNAGVVAAIVALLVVPACIVSTVKPDESIREMFDNIAPKYDLLNHTLSMSIDRIWRRRVVRIVRRCRPHRILDVATGTGDLAIEMARRIRGVQVLGVDLSEGMLDVARRKVTARGLDGRVVLDAGDAEHLHVADASVDVATVAFGVRNFGDLDAGLREMARTIKPGGKVVVLEFSRPRNRLFRALYEFYTYKILPRIGGMVSKDKRAYEYLPASVGEFPAPKEFMAMMERAGFRECRARSQSFGIAQIYTGQK